MISDAKSKQWFLVSFQWSAFSYLSATPQWIISISENEIMRNAVGIGALKGNALEIRDWRLSAMLSAMEQ